MIKVTELLKPRLPRIRGLATLNARAVKEVRCTSPAPIIRKAALAELSMALLPDSISALPQDLQARVGALEAGADEIVGVFTKLPPKGSAGYTALRNGRLLEVHMLKPVAASACTRIGVVVRREMREVLVLIDASGTEQPS